MRRESVIIKIEQSWKAMKAFWLSLQSDFPNDDRSQMNLSIVHLPPKIMENMENREILKSPSVQHVAANIRLMPNGQRLLFEFTCLGDALLLVRLGADASMSLATFIVLCGVGLLIINWLIRILISKKNGHESTPKQRNKDKTKWQNNYKS